MFVDEFRILFVYLFLRVLHYGFHPFLGISYSFFLNCRFYVVFVTTEKQFIIVF